METYRFKTKISKNGIIHVPEGANLFNKKVEISITAETKKTIKKSAATDFVNKWAGFFQSDDTDKAKYNYLSEKYK